MSEQANDKPTAGSAGPAGTAVADLLALNTEALEHQLTILLRSARPEDRALAAQVLSSRGDNRDLHRLLLMAEDELDDSVLATIADGVRSVEGELSTEQLRSLAQHPRERIRRMVASGLYGHNDEQALALLLELVRDPDAEAREWAAWALVDGFPSSPSRDSALDRWLRLTPVDSQLASRVRRALLEEAGASKRAAPPRLRARDRPRKPTSKRLVALVTSANPIETGRLALDEEVRDITHSLRSTPLRDVVELRTAWATRPMDLLEELNEHRPAVLHFSGHGTAGGQLVFLDEQGEAKPVDGEAVAATIETAGESVRVVVLNACFSADLARSLTRHVDVAVGMDRPIGDDAARIFARQFYSALGYGRSVGTAFEQGRTALGLEGMDDRCAPQLSARSGVDPYELVLVDRGATSRYVPAEDHAVLEERTRTHLSYLSRHTTFPLGEGIRVRRSLGAPLKERVQEGSMLLVGTPGSGKTGALCTLAEELRGEGRDVVVLAADLLGASGQRGIAEELGIERNLFDALAAWPGEQPGFLFIDALDAARGREAAGALLSLIAQVAADSRRWHVVASVRSFDLRHSPELRDAFAAERPEHHGFTDPEFGSVRHFAVGKLTLEDLAYVAEQAPVLQDFLDLAAQPVRDLARVPFNLRLLCSLLASEDADVDRLGALRTQLQLLDAYWERRVLEPLDGRDGREHLAESFCEQAVRRLRLQVPRRELLADQGDAPSLDGLLLAGVLTEESDRGIGGVNHVAFAHHLLFDYAVHRLLLTGEDIQLVRRVEESEELVLLARPSVVLALQAKIQDDESWQSFWKLALLLASAEVPVLARLIAPAVAVEQVADAEQFAPLLSSLEHRDSSAAFLLRHLVGARTALGRPAHPLAGADFEPWSALAEQLATDVTVEIAYPLRLLVWGLMMEMDDLTEVEMERFGIAARSMLTWAWQQTPAPWIDIQTGLEGVAHSCASDPVASREILSVALRPQRVEAHGYKELRALAEAVPQLLGCLPDLVGELYETLFGRDEASRDKTAFGTGQILGLTSTRQQDWDMIRYTLAEQYPLVLERDAKVAVQAAIAASRHETQPSTRESQTPREMFDFRAQRSSIVEDMSAIWDSGKSDHRDGAKLLRALEAGLAKAGTDGDIDQVEALLDAVAHAEETPAAIYRQLLRAGTQAPDVFASRLLELVLVEEILIGISTSEPAGAFIAAATGRWPVEDRERVERAIMNIPSHFQSDREEQGIHVRDRLVGCLPADTIATDALRSLREELDAEDGPPANLEPFTFKTEWAEIDPEEYLREQGIDTAATGNRRLLDLTAPVKEFIAAHSNARPTGQEAEEAVPAIVALREGHAELASSADQRLLEDTRAWLSEAAGALATQEPLLVSSRSAPLAHELALEGAQGSLPGLPSEALLEQFESGPHWGVPSGRVEAAKALLLLARDSRFADETSIAAITELAGDPVPAVRLMVARWLGLSPGGQGEWAWQLVKRRAREESSAPVLSSLLHSIIRFAQERPLAGFDTVAAIYEREQAGSGRETLLSEYAGVLLDGWVWMDYAKGRTVVDEWLGDLTANATVAREVFFRLRKVVTAGDDSPEQIAVRQRALGVWVDLTKAAWSTFVAGNRSGADADGLRELARLVDTSATEVYFASGAHAERESENGERLAPKVRRRFYAEAAPTIEVLTNAGIPSIAHHVLQTLATFVEEDPRGVLLRVGKVLDAGRAWGYQQESLAEAEFVALVERYLAAHRDLFLRDRECRDVLVRASESFLEAGWPSARRLIYGLDDMFR